MSDEQETLDGNLEKARQLGALVGAFHTALIDATNLPTGEAVAITRVFTEEWFRAVSRKWVDAQLKEQDA